MTSAGREAPQAAQGRASLVVLHECRADVNAPAGRQLDKALTVAPGELPVGVALLGGVTAQLRQPGPVVLLHSCTGNRVTGPIKYASSAKLLSSLPVCNTQKGAQADRLHTECCVARAS